MSVDPNPFDQFNREDDEWNLDDLYTALGDFLDTETQEHYAEIRWAAKELHNKTRIALEAVRASA